MERRSIGGIEVSLLGLGTSKLASLGGRVSRSAAAHLLDTASDVGVNFIDTADTYGSGACERLLGDLLATRRDQFTVATKGGFVVADLPGPLRPLNQFAKRARQFALGRQDFDPRTIQRRIEGSLRRLRRDVLDVYFLHQPVPSVIAQDELMGVLVDARAMGKIRCLGVSSDDPVVLRDAAATGAFDVIQTPLNETTERDFAAATPALVAAGLDVVVNQTLLSMRVVRESGSVAGTGSGGRTSTTGALLRRAAGRVAVRSVLCGTTRSDHLRENAAALEAPLTEEDR